MLTVAEKCGQAINTRLGHDVDLFLPYTILKAKVNFIYLLLIHFARYSLFDLFFLSHYKNVLDKELTTFSLKCKICVLSEVGV